jgi:hypothetical protein
LRNGTGAYWKVIQHLVSATTLALYNEDGEIIDIKTVGDPGKPEIILYPLGHRLEELTRRIEREKNSPPPEAATAREEEA